MSDGPSLIRDFAHELRNAISPIRSAADVLRVRGSDSAVLDKSLSTAPKTGEENWFVALLKKLGWWQ